MNLDWRAKAMAKIVLTRVPVSYAFWKKLGLFVHGAADDPSYSREVFKKHLERARDRLPRAAGFTSLELGPGDSVMTALLAKTFGGGRAYLVDVGSFAQQNPEPYRRAAQALRDAGLAAPDLSGVADLAGVLKACDGRYLTRGLQSLQEIGTGTIDFIWSHAVLQHVRRGEFDATLAELRRITSKGGIHSHRLNLKDHLADSLNNLRFSTAVWESKLMAGSGFYTNRLRCSEILAAFERAGFDPQVLSVDRWPRPPLDRRRFAPEFRSLAEEDLLIHGVDLLATAA